MRRSGAIEMRLHGGKAPAWLFHRMRRLAREIGLIVIEEYGRDELLRRLSDPYWFQAFGCVLGFDWHSSGLTTTTCGALKEALNPLAKETGLFIAGGKGKTSRRTPEEIERFGETAGISAEGLVYASRMSAKVDSSAVQDGYQLYHHTFIFTEDSRWTVIQQGMNDTNHYARRYHWLSLGDGGDGAHGLDFVNEPHAAVCADTAATTLNMVASESAETRDVCAELAKETPEKLTRELERLVERLPGRHHITAADINPKRLRSIFLKTYERQPEDFETLLGQPGVGAKTIRALTLISELVHGTNPSWRDPARFSFAHGGKDGHPYPVNREVYERSIDHLRKALKQVKVGNLERLEAFKRLDNFRRGNARR